MADPKTVRINDANNPDRLDEFEKALKDTGQNASEVIRQLTDAYLRFVTQHGHGPMFPVQLVPFEKPKALPKPRRKR